MVLKRTNNPDIEITAAIVQSLPSVFTAG